MIKIRRSGDRGHANHSWLKSYHTFSFADYHDPKHLHFRELRVINEDWIAPGMGFGTHPHRDMEIVTYVVSGALRHQDSLGTTAVMRAGDVQRISAGTGVTHSEFNDSADEPVHLLQIWILPDHKGAIPNYAESSFAQLDPGQLRLIASKSGRDDSIPMHQSADIFAGRLAAGATLEHSIAADHGIWLQLIEGKLEAHGQVLAAGDALSVEKEDVLRLRAQEAAHFLLFDLA